MTIIELIAYLLAYYEPTTKLAFYGGDEEYHIEDVYPGDFFYDEETDVLYL